MQSVMQRQRPPRSARASTPAELRALQRHRVVRAKGGADLLRPQLPAHGQWIVGDQSRPSDHR
eukprot:8883623-Pyramimonas_sp.AAC.1